MRNPVIHFIFFTYRYLPFRCIWRQITKLRQRKYMKYDFRVDITKTIEFYFRKMPNKVSLAQATRRMISTIILHKSFFIIFLGDISLFYSCYSLQQKTKACETVNFLHYNQFRSFNFNFSIMDRSRLSEKT